MEPSEPPSYLVYLVLLAGLTLLSMFFSASESAFLSASKLRIRYLAEKGVKAAIRLEKLNETRTILLGIILVGNNIVNIGTSALITAIALPLFGSSGIGIAVGVSTVLLLVFGEIFPKSVALLHPERIALRFSLPLSVLVFIARPLVVFSRAMGKAASRLTGIAAKSRKATVTEEDIRTMIEVGEEEGLIESDKRSMMHKILRYTDLTAREIMVPRTEITMVPVSASLENIQSLITDSPYSRFPVYGKDIDDIKGILYVKDLLFSEGQTRENFTITDKLRPAVFAFESWKLSELQNIFRARNTTLAVIIDEYGGVAGMVTAEDLAEEIFGNLERNAQETASAGVADSSDAAENPARPFHVDGTERLDTLSERLGFVLSSSQFDTLAGFILERVDEIPEPGTTIEVQGFLFTVAGRTGNRITSVLITPQEAAR
ncbi:MAG TPA: hemolysin family protein [Treponemataceae bacterium]|nr:hemolysin family protein [Treponemataceae bacterium]